MNHGEIAVYLDDVIEELDSCLEINEDLLSKLEVFAKQAEQHSSTSQSPSLVLLKEHRVSRPPLPKNHDNLQKDEFARRYLKVLDLSPEWSAHESSVLEQSVDHYNNERNDMSDCIDWNVVVSLCRSRDKEFKRSARSCEIQFLHKSDLDRPWSQEDDAILHALVRETNGTDWNYIGTTLKRPASECFSRSFAILHPLLVPASFSADDDAILSELVKEHGEGAWSTIAIEMGTGHTESQLATRWTKTLKPGIDSSRWNPVLDARLKAAVQIYGEKKWTLVAEHVPGKTDRKCRERYSEKLAPGLKVNQEWDQQEDAILLEQVRAHGAGNWSKIKQALPGRTDQMCRYRYKQLERFISIRKSF
jgi:hypothetical protein